MKHLFISAFPPLAVSDSNQEDLCWRPFSEHNHRGRETVLWPVWEGEWCLRECCWRCLDTCGEFVRGNSSNNDQNRNNGFLCPFITDSHTFVLSAWVQKEINSLETRSTTSHQLSRVWFTANSLRKTSLGFERPPGSEGVTARRRARKRLERVGREK